MAPYLRESFANPSGGHRAARAARRALDDARDVVAEALGFEPGDIAFTAGGTEADNLAVAGVVGATGGTALTSAAEHHAVLASVERVGGLVCPVDRCGRADLDALAALAHPGVRLVSLMLVNNEVGTVQDLEAVGDILAERAPRAVLHTDAVQALTWLDVAQAARPAALVSLSAHKFGGPKGVGVLAVRAGVPLRPLLVGGGQERDRRSGTQNVAGIVAMATAVRLTVETRAATCARVGDLRDRLVTGLSRSVEGLCCTVPPGEADVAPGIVHVCIPDVESEALLFVLEQSDVYAAAGSSCSSGAIQLSHVLAAMGVDPQLGRGALRLSLGYASTVADVDAALATLPTAVAQLRRGAAPRR